MTNTMGRGGYATQAHFANVQKPSIPRSVFDRSAGYKTTFDAGRLIPFFVDEILPGDIVNLTSSAIIRLLTPIFPYMDSVYADFHYFFVPNRLVWENWERFNGAQDNPDDQTDFTVPQLDDATHSAGFAEGSLFDYLGLPTKIASIPQANMPNALVPRAINLIWNEWYRDQNLQDSLPVDIGDGPDTTAYTLPIRNRRKDYFTSGLPWPQKGPDVLMPLGTTAPITATGQTVEWQNGTGWTGYLRANNGSANAALNPTPASSGDLAFLLGGTTGLTAELSQATSATLNQFREAVTLQQFFERDARGGTRYVEYLLAHWGVVSPDFRLQRPEFLGGNTININVNPVAQTNASPATPSYDDTPQGNLAAFAVGIGNTNINKSFVEHGHLIGFVSIRAETTYQQGLNRMWSRQTRFDFADPLFAHLGEQSVPNKEIYMTGSTNPTTGDNATFCYQERYAEYRYRPSIVTGKFRSNATGSLDPWHLAIDFDSLPELADIIPEAPPIDRIVAIPSEPQFQMDSWTNYRHTRALPVYGTPGLSQL